METVGPLPALPSFPAPLSAHTASLLQGLGRTSTRSLGRDSQRERPKDRGALYSNTHLLSRFALEITGKASAAARSLKPREEVRPGEHHSRKGNVAAHSWQGLCLLLSALRGLESQGYRAMQGPGEGVCVTLPARPGKCPVTLASRGSGRSPALQTGADALSCTVPWGPLPWHRVPAAFVPEVSVCAEGPQNGAEGVSILAGSLPRGVSERGVSIAHGSHVLEAEVENHPGMVGRRLRSLARHERAAPPLTLARTGTKMLF